MKSSRQHSYSLEQHFNRKVRGEVEKRSKLRPNPLKINHLPPPSKYRAKLGRLASEPLNFFRRSTGLPGRIPLGKNQGAHLPSPQNFSKKILWINRRGRRGTQSTRKLLAFLCALCGLYKNHFGFRT